jgi:arylsulfatase A-like enzyme
LKPKLPNIILIVMDTMGAKHMSIYGYPRRTTPFLESLAENSTIYSRCFAPSAWTIPSHASMFTGLYPSQHGTFEGNLFLSQNIQHLVSGLKMKGYLTFGISSNGLVSPASGLCRDFDFFKDFTSAYLEGLMPNPAAKASPTILENPGELTDYLSKGINSLEKLKILLRYIQDTGNWQEALERLSEGIRYRLSHLISPSPFFKSSPFTEKSIELSRDIFTQHAGQEKPFFLFINFMEAHEKYRPPLKYRKFSRWSDKQKANMAGFYFQEMTPYFTELLEDNRNLHDDEIYYLDQKIKDIFDALQTNKLLDETVVILTSDHGESFGEKGIYGHNLSLYNELIWVPLIIHYQPGNTPKGENDRLVSLTDLYATVLDLAQCPLPRPESSYSLLDTRRRELAVSQFIYPEKDHNELEALKGSYKSKGMVFSPGIMSLVSESGRKIIEKRDGSIEVYDFSTDKDEKVNLIGTLEKKTVGQFQALLQFLKEDTGYNKALNDAEESYQSGGQMIDLAHY